MMRICILGNSHVNGLLRIWPTMREEEAGRRAALTFFALPDSIQHGIAVRDGKISAISERAQHHMRRYKLDYDIVLAEHDCFIVIGGPGFVGNNFPFMQRLYNGYRAESHLAPPGNAQFVSDLCFESALVGLMRQTPSWHLATSVREQTSAPIAIMPPPLISSRALREGTNMEFMQGLQKNGDEAPLVRSWRAAQRRLAGTQFSVIDQPEETLYSPATTLERFEMGHDHFHMHTEFGRIMVNCCLDWAESVLQPAA
jgi:hypothetical protein